MDIAVSISDSRSLSHSDLILRNLFVALQIGRTVHESSGGVHVERAAFRSGSAEIPLVLTIKNRQTNTVMYVRNVPMSNVLERGGLNEQWIAVYPPGDPQNLHFDSSVDPGRGCPQVCLSIAVEEDPLSGTMANAPAAFSSSGWGSSNFSPGPRLSVVEDSHDGRVEQLRRSITSLQADLKSSRESLAAGRTSPRTGLGMPQSGRNSFMPPTAGPDNGMSFLPPTRQSSQAEFPKAPVIDSAIREKELQAKRIKEHVAEMASAQRRAQDVSRSLQENLDLLAELRRQLKRAEADLVEKRNEAQKLENDRLKLAEEEAGLKQQIAERDKLFQELRDERDGIDRELSQALSEQGRQKNALEASMKNFKLQEKVTQLKSSLANHQQILREKEEAWQMQETARVSREAAEREKLAMELDQTKATLHDAKASKESNLLRLLQVQQGHVEVTTKLSTIQEEISNLQDDSSDSPVRSALADASALLEQKKSKLMEQTVHVERLEKELQENRDQLQAQSTRIADIHAEAQEHELASQRAAQQQSSLEKQLEEKARETQLALKEAEQQRSKMLAAEQESAKRKEELQSLEQEAADSRSRHARLTEDLQKMVEDRNGELRGVKQRVLDLQKDCNELEQTRSSRRIFLEDCIAALSAAQARAKDLEEELAGSEEDLAAAAREAVALEEEEVSRGVALEEARQRLAAQEEELQRLKVAADDGDSAEARIAELDATSLVIRSDVARATEAGERARAEHERLQTELKESELAHEQTKGVLQNLREEKEALDKEVKELSQARESWNQKCETGKQELERLQQASEAKIAELESTRSVLRMKQQEIDDMKAAHAKEVQTLEEEAVCLEAANAESETVSQNISLQIQELEKRRTDAAQALATSQAEKAALESEIEKARQGKELVDQEGAKAMAAVSEAMQALAGEADKQKELAQSEEEATPALHQELSAETERLQQVKDEAHAQSKELANHKLELDQLEAEQRTCLDEIRKLELEISELEERGRNGPPPHEAQENEEQCAALKKELEFLKESTAEALKEASAAVDPEVQQAVREREESLEQVSSQLIQAQAAVRGQRASEEELKEMIQKLRGQMQTSGDKLSYQVEHSKIQAETLQRLEEQKLKQEEELEVLTLALHEQDQENEELEEEVRALQSEVEAAHNGQLKDGDLDVPEWKVAEEEARFKADIAIWKERSELKRTQKTGQLDMLQQQHQTTVERLQERIASVQKEVAQCDETVRSWQEEITRRRGAGSDATALPGLVVSQRPLPMNHQRRKAFLVGVNYTSSHAPLKGCVNDVWNIQCLLRYTLQYSSDQIKVLVDSAYGRPRPDRAPTKANILAGLQWLVADAQPRDHLLFFFSGYGAQHARSPGSDKCEGYLVPLDFAEDLPGNFFEEVARSLAESSGPAEASFDPKAAAGGEDRGNAALDESSRAVAAARAARGNTEAGYRLLSLLEVRDFFCQLPKGCNASVCFDCCYSVLPGVGPRSNCPATFARVQRGKVEYEKLRDFISRPRFLELPTLPVQHTPGHLPRNNSFPACTLHCYSGCRLKEWCAEFPIEGTVQGAFSWAFIKALAQGHFHCGLQQLQQLIVQLVRSLQAQFRGVEQLPVVQCSEAASLQDVVLCT
eukprot:TRINITY_DN26554_c0_g1_i4.p1 TRINITY_DN26554_c0_g1~~TRINITY_DN26554_c0_g1_i4.p1  ORF type:complete len:1627 (+),score=511.56 TRINITY_DN26554_c0_g1_i4:102-4982(+)